MPPSSTWPRVVLFGDSLTQFGYSSQGRWVSLLSDHLQRRCDVVNRGFSGYTSRNYKDLLPSIVTGETMSGVTAATLFLGANDANDPEINPVQAVPLEEYKVN